MIKIAIPTANHYVDSHFGHCAGYTIFTINQEREIIDQTPFPAPAGCGCKTDIASILRREGVTVMLAGNMGQGALTALTNEGIEVVRGCSGDVREVAKLYLAGEIRDSGVGCTEDHHH